MKTQNSTTHKFPHPSHPFDSKSNRMEVVKDKNIKHKNKTNSCYPTSIEVYYAIQRYHFSDRDSIDVPTDSVSAVVPADILLSCEDPRNCVKL